MDEIRNLLKEIGSGQMSSTAYDASWVARLNEIDSELSNRSLEWINENQLTDGGWGAKDIYYYHDRVICTLGAMIALTHRGRRAYDKTQIERGLLALEQITTGATGGLAADPNGATVGFEMIAPTLVAEAEKLGIIKQQGDRILGRLRKSRAAKMDKLSGLKISRHITPAFSSEMAGSDHIGLLDVNNLQESNGSVGNSPAASAYFANYVDKGNIGAISYLKGTIRSDGGVPFAAPFDIFERSWVLWNLALIGPIHDELRSLCMPHLTHLAANWNNHDGVSFSETYTPKDGDDTSFTFSALSQFGLPADIQAVMSYEEEEYFRCYPLETNSSISVNIHALDALKQGGFEKKHPSVKKIISYLRLNRIEDTFWHDKWHTSPFYPTAHVIIAAHNYDFAMCERAVNWILSMQKANGSWGSMPGISTAEETAYCIQALKVWENYSGKIPKGRIEQAANWLERNSDGPYPSLWIGKVLYCPEYVVKSTVLSAMALSRS